MVTTKQKPIVDSQKIKESKHTTTENNQITKEVKKKVRNNAAIKTTRNQLTKWQ